MIKRYLFILFMTLVLISTGCIKETYDMNKFSGKIHYSPTLAIAAKGDITLSDIVKSNDTVVFDNDNFIRIILKQDSVINKKLKDYYNLDDMVSFSKGYVVGELKLDDFQATIPISLNTISTSFSPALRAQFVALNGSTFPFPPFPQTDIGEKSFSGISNFQNAVFSSGTLTISVKNDLNTPLGSIKISLFNSIGHTPIGGQLIIPAIAAGATQSATLDLAGKTLTNSIVAAIVFTGSTGTTSPVLIDLNSTVQIDIKTSNLKVQSGRIKLPAQKINTLDSVSIISFNPGSGIEIEKLKILTGNINYNLISKSGIMGSFYFTIPTTPAVAKTIQINGNTNIKDSIPVNNTDIDLSTDASQRFNRIPVKYSITLNSNGNFIDFNMSDSIHIDINMLNPDFDYVKGYFGEMSKQIDPQIMDTGLDEFLNNLTGKFHISDPSIKLNYSNSFGIPIEVTMNASGKRNTQTINLGLLPFKIKYPTSLSVRDVDSSFAINKTNSLLADLISLPPSEITFSGSVKMNPSVATDGRNNYVFGESRFFAKLEVEVPMELWINNLQFSDTVDNFLDTIGSDNNAFKPEDIDSILLNVTVQNGFPLGVSLQLMLYDSVNKSVLKTINATDFLQPAQVDNGKVTVAESSTTIEIGKDFFDSIKNADKIIFMFTLNTTGNGTQDVKIYSNYYISFTASLIAKPDLVIHIK